MEDVFLKNFFKFSQDNVSTVTRLQAGWSGFRIPVAVRDFSSPKHPDELWVSTSVLSNGYRGHTPEVKRLGHKADHSPQSR
jgi:hypothetical protein